MRSASTPPSPIGGSDATSWFLSVRSKKCPPAMPTCIDNHVVELIQGRDVGLHFIIGAHEHELRGLVDRAQELIEKQRVIFAVAIAIADDSPS